MPAPRAAITQAENNLPSDALQNAMTVKGSVYLQAVPNLIQLAPPVSVNVFTGTL